VLRVLEVASSRSMTSGGGSGDSDTSQAFVFWCTKYTFTSRQEGANKPRVWFPVALVSRVISIGKFLPIS